MRVERVSEAIKELEHVLNTHGDIPLQLMNNPAQETSPGEIVTDREVFFVVEGYDEGYVVNIRNWPY